MPLVCPTDFNMPSSRRRSSMASATALAMMMTPAIIASEAMAVSMMMKLFRMLLMSERELCQIQVCGVGYRRLHFVERLVDWLGFRINE